MSEKGGASLEMGRRGRGRVAAVLLPVVLLGLLAGFVVWYVNSPGDLPSSERSIRASGAVGEPVYIGVFTADADFDRELEVSGVKVHTTSDAPLTVEPMLCRDGTLGVTTDPAAFCGELVDPEGEIFGDGDSIVLKVVGDAAATATIDPVRIGFREGFQWGTEVAGTGAEVRIFGRDDVVDPAEPDDSGTPPTESPSDPEVTESPTDPAVPTDPTDGFSQAPTDQPTTNDDGADLT